jgi:hypothetical protein
MSMLHSRRRQRRRTAHSTASSSMRWRLLHKRTGHQLEISQTVTNQKPSALISFPDQTLICVGRVVTVRSDIASLQIDVHHHPALLGRTLCVNRYCTAATIATMPEDISQLYVDSPQACSNTYVRVLCARAHARARTHVTTCHRKGIKCYAIRSSG